MPDPRRMGSLLSSLALYDIVPWSLRLMTSGNWLMQRITLGLFISHCWACGVCLQNVSQAFPTYLQHVKAVSGKIKTATD